MKGYACNGCGELIAQKDMVRLYECPICGALFTEDASAGNHRCPDCNRFGRTFSERGCPECGEGECSDELTSDGDGDDEDEEGEPLEASEFPDESALDDEDAPLSSLPPLSLEEYQRLRQELLKEFREHEKKVADYWDKVRGTEI